MAGRAKQQSKKGQQGGKEAAPRQVPKMKVIESGRAEQGEETEAGVAAPKGGQPAAREVAKQEEREEYRHSGIPIGSDPRE
jgi:hypothetical protein